MTEKSALCCVISISREAYKLIYGGAEINPAALDLLSNALSHTGNAERPLKSLMRPLKRELKPADVELFCKSQRFFSPLFSAVNFDEKRAAIIKTEEAAKIRTDVEVRITGSDIDPKAIERAKKNAEYACVMAGRALKSIGISAHIQRPDFVQADFKDLSAPYESGLLLCNPPYGERLGDEKEAQELYKQMDSLWTEFPKWDLGVITSYKDFEKTFNHPTGNKKIIKAGNLDTTFYIYKRNMPEQKILKNQKKTENKNFKHKVNKEKY